MQTKKRRGNEISSQKCTTCYSLSFGQKTPVKPTFWARPSSLTRIQGDLDIFLCSKCRNGYYRAIKVYINKIVDNYEESKFSQDILNNFTFRYLNNKVNCKKFKSLDDFYTFGLSKYVKASFGAVPDESRSVVGEDAEADRESGTFCDCGFCGFRITFFIFKVPNLELFASEKVFKDLLSRLWDGMLSFLKVKLPNIGSFFDAFPVSRD